MNVNYRKGEEKNNKNKSKMKLHSHTPFTFLIEEKKPHTHAFIYS